MGKQMINASQALEITRISLDAKSYTLAYLENEIRASANLGLASVNVAEDSISPLYRDYLNRLGYKVLDCRFDDEWYVQISWDNK